MSAPVPNGAPPPGFIYPVVAPADVEAMALTFLNQYMAPTPVATRMPDDTSPGDTEYGFIRVEAGGGVKLNYIQYNQTVQVHTYVPNEYEVQGANIANTAIAYMSAATGQTILGHYITDVPNVSVVQRRTDPRINLLRYMFFVTWTIDGQVSSP